MFDPTVFENLKVAIENIVYDMDNLDGQVRITGRRDLIELAQMSRELSLRFETTKPNGVAAEIRLQASLKDLAAEILEIPGENPGCALSLRFYMDVHDLDSSCKKIDEVIQTIWKPDNSPTQSLTFVYGEERIVYKNVIEVRFGHSINESHMGDIPQLLEHMLLTLQELGSLAGLEQS